MRKENLNHLQSLHNLQSLSRYALVSKELPLEKYYRVVNFTDLFNEDAFNEVV